MKSVAHNSTITCMILHFFIVAAIYKLKQFDFRQNINFMNYKSYVMSLYVYLVYFHNIPITEHTSF